MTALNGPVRAPYAGGEAKHLVVLLHGVGSNGDDLISLADLWAPMLPHTAFIAPNGCQPFDMAPMGYQWFSLRDYTMPAIMAGADAALPVLQGFLDEKLAEYRLNDRHLALVGFSQGTMMSLHAGLHRANPCAGILGYSGLLASVDRITVKPPVCLVHGEYDEVVPFAAMDIAKKALSAAEVSVEAHARPMLGHSIDQEGLRLGLDFLRKVLSA